MGRRARRRRQRANDGPVPTGAPTTQAAGEDDALGLVGLVLIYPFACWGLYNTSRTIWRIVTTGSTCPGRRCVSWDDNAFSVALHFICNSAFTVVLATIVIGGIVTLLRGGRMS